MGDSISAKRPSKDLKMPARVSPRFAPVSLEGAFNAHRSELPARLAPPPGDGELYGAQAIRGMPFRFGELGRANVLLLDGQAITVRLDGARATYLLFIHVAEDDEDAGHGVFSPAAGNRLGGLVSQYELEFEDGSVETCPIIRRLAIGQARGIASFIGSMACVPLAAERAVLTLEEYLALGEFPEWLRAPSVIPPTVIRVGTTDPYRGPAAGVLWMYALRNPKPAVPLQAVVCRPRDERSAVYAVSMTDVVEHPLRRQVRRKLRLRLPPGVELNVLGEVDDSDIGIDLGAVISARAALKYPGRWSEDVPIIEPQRLEREVIVEFASHPAGRLYVGDEVHELDSLDGAAIARVATADRPVRLRFTDRESGSSVAVRLHIHGKAGEYLPPRGHHRKVNRVWHQDNYAEFATAENQYAYVDGECIIDLPLGMVFVEISRGYEVEPIRTTVEVTPETNELVFELDRVLRWRERGWVTADTHVHFLSPKTALLEGQAEGVNVVNLLASQWGEMHSNVGDFDGNTTFGSKEFGGDGEFLVRVGSENRMSPLGHISLLGYKGALIHPLGSAGPRESALGDPLEVTLAEWARRCIDQGGLVVLPHGQWRVPEHSADVVLGIIDAFELMSHNPLLEEMNSPLDSYGLAGWYRYLNLGHQIPLTGGSDKMSAAHLLGGIRTYANLGDLDFTYENWLEAVRRGNTFVTVGPLAALKVEGVVPGGRLNLAAGGGTVQVEWRVESLRVPIEAVEVVVGGRVAGSTSVGGQLQVGGQTAIRVSTSTWIALRIRGSYHGKTEDIAAHTSAVQVLVDGAELFSQPDAIEVLDQIQSAIAYVDTIAPRAEARRFAELRVTLHTAYNRLHQRMHAAGVYHHHVVHDPAESHEH